MSAVFPDKNTTGKPNGRGAVFNKLAPQQPAAVTQDEVMPRMLDPQEMEWKKQVSESLLELMDLSLIATIPEKDARSQIRSMSAKLLDEASAPLSRAQRQQIIRCIEDDVMGLGPLEPLLADKSVSDILVNGADQVYVERRGKLEATDIRYEAAVAEEIQIRESLHGLASQVTETEQRLAILRLTAEEVVRELYMTAGSDGAVSTVLGSGALKFQPQTGKTNYF